MSAASDALKRRVMPHPEDAGYDAVVDEVYCMVGDLIDAHLDDPLAISLPPTLVKFLNGRLEAVTSLDDDYPVAA